MQELSAMLSGKEKPRRASKFLDLPEKIPEVRKGPGAPVVDLDDLDDDDLEVRDD